MPKRSTRSIRRGGASPPVRWPITSGLKSLASARAACRRARAAGASEPAQIGHGGELKPAEYMLTEVPDTSRCLPPAVYRAIGNYVREAPDRRAARLMGLAQVT